MWRLMGGRATKQNHRRSRSLAGQLSGRPSPTFDQLARGMKRAGRPYGTLSEVKTHGLKGEQVLTHEEEPYARDGGRAGGRPLGSNHAERRDGAKR